MASLKLQWPCCLLSLLYSYFLMIFILNLTSLLLENAIYELPVWLDLHSSTILYKRLATEPRYFVFENQRHQFTKETDCSIGRRLESA